METFPRCHTNGRALPRDFPDTQNVRHKLCYLAMNSDPKLFYQYSAFSLTLLSNSERYCRQWGTGLPVIIDKAAPEGTLQHHIYGIRQRWWGGRREQMRSGMKRSWAMIPVSMYELWPECEMCQQLSHLPPSLFPAQQMVGERRSVNVNNVFDGK